jgi:hypothetical protein
MEREGLLLTPLRYPCSPLFIGKIIFIAIYLFILSQLILVNLLSQNEQSFNFRYQGTITIKIKTFAEI